jgi:hypothetical protein
MRRLSNPIPEQQYAFTIPRGLKVMWSARAIYTVKPEPFIDILPDRQYMFGENESREGQELCSWLNTVGIKGLQKQCNELNVSPNERREVAFRSGGFVIKGNPNASYGYLYIVAYPLPGESQQT